MRLPLAFVLLGFSLAACSSADDAARGAARSAVEVGSTVDAGSAVDTVSAVDPGNPDGALRMTHKCSKTYCEWSTDVRDDAYRTCRSTCANMPIPNCGRCNAEEYVCEEWEKTTCHEETFALSKPLTPDPVIEAACNGFFDHLDACKLVLQDLTRTDCASFARQDGPPVATFFDCHSALACDGDGSTCNFPPSMLGDEIASTYRAKCGEAAFTEAQRTSYDGLGAERNDALVAAAKACVTDNGCDLVASCLAAWWALE